MRIEDCFYCDNELPIKHDEGRVIFKWHLNGHDKRADTFVEATKIMRVTNEILDLIKTSIEERQLLNDKVDNILKNYTSEIKNEVYEECITSLKNIKKML